MVSPILMVGSISGCVHSNQYGIFWQVEIRAIRHPLLVRAWLTGTAALLLQCIRNKTPDGAAFSKRTENPQAYFFSVAARKSTVRFHASAASSARYPSLLFGFSKA